MANGWKHQEEAKPELSSCESDDRGHVLTVDRTYLQSSRALLLLGGLVLCLIAFCMVNATRWCVERYSCQISGYTAIYYFFSTVTCFIFLSSLFLLGFFTISLHKLVHIKRFTLTDHHFFIVDTGYGCFACILLFMAVILMAPRTGSRSAFQGAIISGALAWLFFFTRSYFMIRQMKLQDQQHMSETEHSEHHSHRSEIDNNGHTEQVPRLQFIQRGEFGQESDDEMTDDDSMCCHQVAWRPLDDNQSTQTFTVDVDPSVS